MGKAIFWCLIFAVACELALWQFAGTTYTNTNLFNLITQLDDLNSNLIYMAVLSAAAIFSAATIIAGNFFQINIYGVFAGLVTSIVTFSANIVHLSTFVYGQLAGNETTAALMSANMANTIVWVTIGPLALLYLIVSIEWVRSN